MEHWTLTLIGTGTAFPQGDRNPTCSLVSNGEYHAVFDLGSGSLSRLAALGVTPANIDVVCITHAHFDHITDLLPLLFVLTVPVYPRTKPPLKLVMSAATKRVLDGFRAASEGLAPDASRLEEIVVAPNELVEIGDNVFVDIYAVQHTESSVGFRLILPNQGIVAIPGDSGPCQGLVDNCRDADVVVIECSVSDEYAMDSHLSPASLRALLAEAKPGIALVTHRYPVVMGVDIVEVCQGLPVFVSTPSDGYPHPILPRNR